MKSDEEWREVYGMKGYVYNPNGIRTNTDGELYADAHFDPDLARDKYHMTEEEITAKQEGNVVLVHFPKEKDCNN